MICLCFLWHPNWKFSRSLETWILRAALFLLLRKSAHNIWVCRLVIVNLCFISGQYKPDIISISYSQVIHWFTCEYLYCWRNIKQWLLALLLMIQKVSRTAALVAFNLKWYGFASRKEDTLPCSRCKWTMPYFISEETSCTIAYKM